jgi:excisionase family DNA binding protein
MTIITTRPLSSDEAAKYLGYSRGTLANLRINGNGPRYIKRGKVLYMQQDLDAWLEERMVTSTTEAKAKVRMEATASTQKTSTYVDQT